MSAEFALLLWLLVVVILFFIVRSLRITWWSSFVFAIFIGWIVLMFAFPWGSGFSVNGASLAFDGAYTGAYALMALISLVSIIILIVYLFQKVFTDREACPPAECM